MALWSKPLLCKCEDVGSDPPEPMQMPFGYGSLPVRKGSEAGDRVPQHELAKETNHIGKFSV